MNYTTVENPRYADVGNALIGCDVTFENIGTVPFTASPNDTEAHGVEIFNRCVAGDFGTIAPYVDNSPTEAEMLVSWRASATCGALEMRRALRATGSLTAVTDYIATADELTQEAWQYATLFKRNDPLVLGVQALLGKTDTEVDDIFRLAVTLG